MHGFGVKKGRAWEVCLRYRLDHGDQPYPYENKHSLLSATPYLAPLADPIDCEQHSQKISFPRQASRSRSFGLALQVEFQPAIITGLEFEPVFH
jgi:hypothetical protein